MALNPTTYADLTPLFVKGCDDMVVDMNGRAYVGSFPDVGVRSAGSSPWTRTGRRVSLQTR